MLNKERIEILIMIGYGDRRQNHTEVRNLFNATYTDRNPIAKSKTKKRFTETGIVKNRLKFGRPKTATNNENSVNVMLVLLIRQGLCYSNQQ